MDLRRLERNIAANEAYVKINYPGENFISDTAELRAANRYTKKLTLPENVRVAASRVNIKSNEEKRTLRKELRQAGILSRMGNSVFLTPEKPKFGVRVTDGIINGLPYEFRNVTGKVRRIETRFRDAKRKGDKVNVFMNIEPNVSHNEARRRIGLVLGSHPEYTGKIIASLGNGKRIYFWDSKGFR